MSGKGKGKEKASSSSSDEIQVTGIWDAENARIPPNYDIRNLTKRIDEALKKCDPRFTLKELVAFGPDSLNNLLRHAGPKVRPSAIPRENIRCATCGYLFMLDPQNPQERTMRNTDVSDKFAIQEVYLSALEHKVLEKKGAVQEKKYMLIITGDFDFLRVIEDAYGKDIHVLLSRLDDPQGSGLKGSKAQHTWLWNSNDLEKVPENQTMLYGGGPRPYCC